MHEVRDHDGRGSMQYVQIPFGFENLSPEEQGATVPICIQRTDRHGKDIEWGWFEAVSEVQDKLRGLARTWLEDVWRGLVVAVGSAHYPLDTPWAGLCVG